MATIVTPNWNATHLAVHREDLIGGSGELELSLLRHPSYPFLAEISAARSTMFAELCSVAHDYIGRVAQLDGSLSKADTSPGMSDAPPGKTETRPSTTDDSLGKTEASPSEVDGLLGKALGFLELGAPAGFGWLPITWDGQTGESGLRDPRGSFAVRRSKGGTEFDRTIVLMASNRRLNADVIENADGIAVGLRVVMHVDPPTDRKTLPIRVTGLSMCELGRALDPTHEAKHIEQFHLYRDEVVQLAQQNLRFSPDTVIVSGCDLMTTSGVLRFAGVGSRSGSGKDEMGTGILWNVDATLDQGTLRIFAVREQKQHTYAVAPAMPERKNYKARSSKIGSRTKKNTPNEKKIPRLFFRDPASCGLAVDVVKRSPTADSDMLDRFREDASFLTSRLEDPERRFQVLQSPVADQDNDPRHVQLIDPHDLPLRSDHLSAAQAYLRAREFFARLSAFNLPEKEFFKFARLPLLMRPRAAFNAHPDGNAVMAQVRIVAPPPIPLPDGGDTAISDKAASVGTTSDTATCDSRPRLEVAFGSAALSLREVHPDDHRRRSAQPLGIAADPRWAWHEFGHVISYAATGALEYEFAHSAGDALAAVLNDATSLLAGQGLYDGETYPWVPAGRRHDRDAAAGWCWCGRRNGQRRATPTFPPQLFKGYVEEQMLSSSVFRFYRAIGGHPGNPAAMRERAAGATAYLLMRAALLLGPGAMVPARSADAMVSAMVDADIGTRPTDELFPGGCLHKVVRWSFERQGLFATASPREDVEGPGLPPTVDLWVMDRRPNADDGGYESVTLEWPTAQPEPSWFADPEKGVWDDADGNIHVMVRNRGAQSATDVTVKAWAAPVGSGPLQWQYLGADHLATVPRGDSALATIAAKLGGDMQYVFVDVSSSEDASNLDAGTRLPCAIGTPPAQPEALRDLVANDNNLALRLIKGRSVATPQQRGKQRAP